MVKPSTSLYERYKYWRYEWLGSRLLPYEAKNAYRLALSDITDEVAEKLVPLPPVYHLMGFGATCEYDYNGHSFKVTVSEEERASLDDWFESYGKCRHDIKLHDGDLDNYKYSGVVLERSSRRPLIFVFNDDDTLLGLYEQHRKRKLGRALSMDLAIERFEANCKMIKEYYDGDGEVGYIVYVKCDELNMIDWYDNTVYEESEFKQAARWVQEIIESNFLT